MIPIKSGEEVEKINKSVQLLVRTFRELENQIRAGIRTEELDRFAEEIIRGGGGRPAFKGYRGYPATICISVESEVVHGIPGKRILKEGELVSLDMGVELDGYFSDAAKTYGVGEISGDRRKLMEATRIALYRGIKKCRSGNRLTDISHAIQTYVESRGFSVVRALVGHGIGKQLHEDPQIPNFGPPKTGPILKPGMVLAIEPMINMGSHEVVFMDDKWTVRTVDGLPSAHFEHMILITEGKPEILTLGIEDGDFGRENDEGTGN